MNITSVLYRFPAQGSCIAHLGKMRCGNDSHYPYCGSAGNERGNPNAFGAFTPVFFA